MLEIAIPSRVALRLEYLVLDVNGTIALDGQLLPGIGERLDRLGELLTVWLVSADTQGSLASLAADLKAQVRRLQAGDGDEAAQKAALVAELGADRVVAIGNGANDAAMVRQAALGIAVLGGEGLAAACWQAAGVVVPDIGAALDLLLRPRRLVATLRA
jgi:soluble P-type ATPase